jgi:hypothetical protein
LERHSECATVLRHHPAELTTAVGCHRDVLLIPRSLPRVFKRSFWLAALKLSGIDPASGAPGPEAYAGWYLSQRMLPGSLGA